MINVMTENQRPEDCCGCGACHALCECIQMVPDAEGFPIPKVDEACCIDCGRCLAVCPMRKPRPEAGARPPEAVFAAQRTNEDLLRASTSGGLFSVLAEAVLDEGGVVFGARYGEGLVVQHAAARNLRELAALRGSKYVQSDTGETFQEVQKLLARGTTVLYSGTPCQIAGLKDLTGTDEHLLTCDLLCHGVPSPALFQQYVQFEEKRVGNSLVGFEFRNKGKGWIPSLRIVKRFQSGRIECERGRYNLYMQPFLQNYSIRMACYACPFASRDREGDWTIADYWGVEHVHPDFPGRQKGVSLWMVNTPKGQLWFDKVKDKVICHESSFDQAFSHHRPCTRPVRKPPERSTFYLDAQTLPFDQLTKKYCVQASVLKKWVMKLLRWM